MSDNQLIKYQKKSISIVGMGWLGLPLGKFLANRPYLVKGSTTTTSKLKDISEAGVKGYLLTLPGLEHSKDFFDSDILVISMPPSVNQYDQVIDSLLGAIVTHQVPWVIFVSSTSVYPNIGGSVSEEDAVDIASPHSGVQLLQIENLFRDNRKFDTTIIRFAGLYGPSREPGRFMAGKKDVRGADIPVNLIHQEDCIGIISQVIEKEIKGQTFNACAPEHPNRKDFYTKACRGLGLEPPQFNSETAPFKIIDSSKLIKKLPYEFIHKNPLLDL
ncbi:SDR family oxidoreductase [Fulvivirga sp. 29W222]|uniref:SDR family oxidoreductase n=1 Tax=Fulvivirga marina TaxID=2494733 RepID=A0A937FZQ2_9BACT|nr:SDR family oxidoreductase [Fulvivirga marina]MBL6447456.1 SDR family oxidoreductase [Fulvivirga marina]